METQHILLSIRQANIISKIRLQQIKLSLFKVTHITFIVLPANLGNGWKKHQLGKKKKKKRMDEALGRAFDAENQH